MLELLALIVENPYADLIVAVTMLVAVGFLIFFWGFTGYFLAHGDFEHQANARRQMVQGLTLFASLVVLWEVIRWIGGLFT
ncbi:MAG: hypothetical protein G01um101456_422 [Parcubacteria group bacterium Gr01-1014_56]|nr:MAG: hypothetical protein G01um101456_422 [Parcubacteria group bacterium Gr01-1014_56]